MKFQDPPRSHAPSPVFFPVRSLILCVYIYIYIHTHITYRYISLYIYIYIFIFFYIFTDLFIYTYLRRTAVMPAEAPSRLRPVWMQGPDLGTFGPLVGLQCGDEWFWGVGLGFRYV